jgi:hypothetical protein
MSPHKAPLKSNIFTSTHVGLSAFALAIIAVFGSNIASAQTILVADPNGTSGIRSYDINGTQINGSLVPGTDFQGLAISGSTVYISDMSVGDTHIRTATLNGTGGVASTGYFTSGGVMNGLNSPYGLALTATHMYIANFNSGHVFKYDRSSYLQVGSIYTPNSNGGAIPNPYGVAIKDNILWVSQATTGIGAGTIKGYNLTTFSSVPLITITSLNLPHGLEVAGNTLYVANSSPTLGGGTIQTFDATNGTPLATLVTGLTGPQGLTVYGNNLYVTGSDGTVKGFDATTGAVLAGFTTITGLSSPHGIVVTPQSVGTMAIGLYAGLTLTGTVGSQYTIEYTTNLNGSPVIWTPLTSGTLNTSPFLYVDSSVVSGSRFYRATFQ